MYNTPHIVTASQNITLSSLLEILLLLIQLNVYCVFCVGNGG